MSCLNTDSNCSTDVQLFSRVALRQSARGSDFSSRIQSIIADQAKSWQEAKRSVDVELEALRSKLAMAKELTEQQKRKIGNLLVQKEMLQSRLDDEIRKRENTLSQLTRALKMHDRYKTQHMLLDSEMQHLQQRVETVCKDTVSQQQERESITQQYRQLEAAYEAKRQEAADLSQSLKVTQSSEQSLLALNKEIEQQLTEIKQEKLVLEKQVIDTLSKQQQLKSTVEQQDSAFAAMTARCESLLKDLETEKLAREQELARVQQQWTQEANQRQLALNAKEDELNRHKEMSETANNKLSLLQDKCEHLETRLSQATQEIRDVKLLNSSLEDQIQMRQEELNQLRAMVALKEEKIEDLEKAVKDTSENEALKQKVVDLENEVKKWEEDYERILYGYDFFRKTSEEWGPMYFEKERQWREAVQERADQAKKIESLEVDNRNLEEEVKRLEEKLQQLSEEMKTSRRQQASEKEKTLSDFEVRFSNLRLELEQEKSHSRELDVKLEAERELTARHTAELNEKRAFTEKKLKEIETLEQQLADKHNQISVLESTVEKLEHMVGSLQAACKTPTAADEEAPKAQNLSFQININHETPTEASAVCSQPISSGNIFDASPLCSLEAPIVNDLISPSTPEESRTNAYINQVNTTKEPSVPTSVWQPDPEWLRPPPAASVSKKPASTFDPYAFSQDSCNSNDFVLFAPRSKKPGMSTFLKFSSVRKRVNFDTDDEMRAPAKVTRQISPTKHFDNAVINPGPKLSEAGTGDTRGKGRGRASGRGRARTTGSGRGQGRGIVTGASKFDGKMEQWGKFDENSLGNTSCKTTRSGRKSFPTVNPRDLYASLVSSDSD